VQQHLVALSVALQLVRSLAATDPEAAVDRLEEADRDLGAALQAAAQLAHRISAPVSGPSGLGAALRAAAVGRGTSASVGVEHGVACSPEVARTVYLLWLDALERDATAPTSIAVSCGADAIEFEIGVTATPEAFAARRDRVEALGGSLAVEPAPGGGVRMWGTLPRSETLG
jgi:signal transduction histidine kinase